MSGLPPRGPPRSRPVISHGSRLPLTYPVRGVPRPPRYPQAPFQPSRRPPHSGMTPMRHRLPPPGFRHPQHHREREVKDENSTGAEQLELNKGSEVATAISAAPSGADSAQAPDALPTQRASVLHPHPDSIDDDDCGQFSPIRDEDDEATPVNGVDPSGAEAVFKHSPSASSDPIAEQRRLAEERRKAAARTAAVDDAFEVETESDVASLFSPPMKKEGGEEQENIKKALGEYREEFSHYMDLPPAPRLVRRSPTESSRPHDRYNGVSKTKISPVVRSSRATPEECESDAKRKRISLNDYKQRRTDSNDSLSFFQNEQNSYHDASRPRDFDQRAGSDAYNEEGRGRSSSSGWEWRGGRPPSHSRRPDLDRHHPHHPEVKREAQPHPRNRSVGAASREDAQRTASMPVKRRLPDDSPAASSKKRPDRRGFPGDGAEPKDAAGVNKIEVAKRRKEARRETSLGMRYIRRNLKTMNSRENGKDRRKAQHWNQALKHESSPDLTAESSQHQDPLNRLVHYRANQRQSYHDEGHSEYMGEVKREATSREPSPDLEELLFAPLTNQTPAWTRSSPADVFYQRDLCNPRVMNGTTRIEVLVEKFKGDILSRGEVSLRGAAKYDPPSRRVALQHVHRHSCCGRKKQKEEEEDHHQHRHQHNHKKNEEEESSTSSSEDEDEDDADSTFDWMDELERKKVHPRRAHTELWFNEPAQLNDGPICRCSLRARKSGIRHIVYPGEDKVEVEKCLWGTNNGDKLHHYRILISPHTNFLLKNPTIVEHDGHDYIFEGFSILTHHPVADIPDCRVIRFNIEYTIVLQEEKLPDNFTVGELELFKYFVYEEVLELMDLDWALKTQYKLFDEFDVGIASEDDDVGRSMKCPLFHLMPRFGRDLPDNGKELLSMNQVLLYLIKSAKPLVSDKDLERIPFMTESEWKSFVGEVRGTIVTRPGSLPSSIRVDQLDREVDKNRLTGSVVYPELVHFGIRPAQLSYAGDPKYQKAWKQYVKLKHLLYNKPKITDSDREKLESKLEQLQDIRTKSSMKREVTVAMSSEGWMRTGLRSDVTQHALIIPVLTSHIRFHRCLKELETIIGYQFKDRRLLQLALTHPSYRVNYGTNPDHARNSLSNCGIRQPSYGDRSIHFVNSRKRGINTLIYIMSKMGQKQEKLSDILHNERLEYLGDAVVEFLTSIHLFFMFPDLEEGGLSTYRAAIVQNQHLAVLAKKLRLQDFMLYAHGPDLCHDSDLKHAMANCYEALMGAVYLDSGIQQADRILASCLFPEEHLYNIWMNLPRHPLQEQEETGDRHWIKRVKALEKLTKFEMDIGVEFTHIRLLARAFTLRSVGYNNLCLGHNQRMEFLGDTILQLIASDYLYRHFPEHHEGHLSLLRSSLVNNRTQAQVFDELGMEQFVIHANDRKAKFDMKTKERADVLEALLGALYVDKDLEYCKVLCNVCFFPRLESFILNQEWNDPKSQLQQCCLTLRSLEEGEPDIPVYKVVESKGPTNTRTYTVAVYFRGVRLAKGQGHSIQQAEMDAAGNALEECRSLFPQLEHQKRVIEKKYHFYKDGKGLASVGPVGAKIHDRREEDWNREKENKLKVLLEKLDKRNRDEDLAKGFVDPYARGVDESISDGLKPMQYRIPQETGKRNWAKDKTERGRYFEKISREDRPRSADREGFGNSNLDEIAISSSQSPRSEVVPTFDRPSPDASLQKERVRREASERPGSSIERVSSSMSRGEMVEHSPSSESELRSTKNPREDVRNDSDSATNSQHSLSRKIDQQLEESYLINARHSADVKPSINEDQSNSSQDKSHKFDRFPMEHNRRSDRYARDYHDIYDREEHRRYAYDVRTNRQYDDRRSTERHSLDRQADRPSAERYLSEYHPDNRRNFTRHSSDWSQYERSSTERLPNRRHDSFGRQGSNADRTSPTPKRLLSDTRALSPIRDEQSSSAIGGVEDVSDNELDCKSPSDPQLQSNVQMATTVAQTSSSVPREGPSCLENSCSAPKISDTKLIEEEPEEGELLDEEDDVKQPANASSTPNPPQALPRAVSVSRSSLDSSHTAAEVRHRDDETLRIRERDSSSTEEPFRRAERDNWESVNNDKRRMREGEERSSGAKHPPESRGWEDDPRRRESYENRRRERERPIADAYEDERLRRREYDDGYGRRNDPAPEDQRSRDLSHQESRPHDERQPRPEEEFRQRREEASASVSRDRDLYQERESDYRLAQRSRERDYDSERGATRDRSETDMYSRDRDPYYREKPLAVSRRRDEEYRSSSRDSRPDPGEPYGRPPPVEAHRDSRPVPSNHYHDDRHFVNSRSNSRDSSRDYYYDSRHVYEETGRLHAASARPRNLSYATRLDSSTSSFSSSRYSGGRDDRARSSSPRPPYYSPREAYYRRHPEGISSTPRPASAAPPPPTLNEGYAEAQRTRDHYHSYVRETPGRDLKVLPAPLPPSSHLELSRSLKESLMSTTDDDEGINFVRDVLRS